MYHRLEVSPKKCCQDPKGDQVSNQIRDFLHLSVEKVRTRQVYSLYVDCSADEAQDIVECFANQVIEDCAIGENDPSSDFDWLVVVGFKPGVTDNVARSARTAITDIINRKLNNDEKIFTSMEYFITATNLERKDAELIAKGLLANELIESATIMTKEEWQKNGIPANKPEFLDDSEPITKIIDLQVSDEELMKISSEGVLALSLEEMQTLKKYFADSAEKRKVIGLPANPTDVELECLAQTWSEHCKHKIFAAKINYCDENGNKETIDSVFKTYIYNSTKEIEKEVDWLVSIFHDNAGVIKFNDEINIVYKVETHNSPTALDPYGGAMTGIVGVNRDPMGTGLGAKNMLNVWGYCFGSPFTERSEVPKGLFHPRRLRDQVHKGIIDGGNQSGIPYAAGWEYFDKRYLGKPLVYCGTVATIPITIKGQASEDKCIKDGDLIVMTGGRIGKDGIHGATFSSEELHKDSPVQAVQIGDPITQKIMTDFIMEIRDKALYRFITDNGAGGLSSSIGEMAELSGGCEMDLAKAPLKYDGLQPWEILISEAQERMSFAVQPENIDAFLKLAEERNVEATVLGTFTNTGKFIMKYNEETVAHLDIEFMHDGDPQLVLEAKWQPPTHDEPNIPADLDYNDTLKKLMSSLNICSGEFKARQYDHEVKGLSVIKPYIGVDRNIATDATVSMVKPLGKDGVILSTGLAPRYSDIDTYDMMASIIDMSVRKIIAVGGKTGHIAGLDNFCWPDPVQSPKTPDGEYKAAQLVRANKALYEYTKAFQVPCISGKDSMKNDSTIGGKKISIPPTVLFSAISKMDDISKSITLDAKRADDLVYVLGTTYNELGGSEFFSLFDCIGNNVPKVDSEKALSLYDAVSKATAKELCHSLHTPVLGGLAIGFAKSATAGKLGMEIDLDAIPTTNSIEAWETLFSESNSRFIATVPVKNKEAFEALMDNQAYALVGKTTAEPQLKISTAGKVIVDLSIAELTNAYAKTLNNI